MVNSLFVRSFVAVELTFSSCDPRRPQEPCRPRIVGQVQGGRQDLLPGTHARSGTTTGLSHGLLRRRHPNDHLEPARDRYRAGGDEGADRYQGVHSTALCLCLSQGGFENVRLNKLRLTLTCSICSTRSYTAHGSIETCHSAESRGMKRNSACSAGPTLSWSNSHLTLVPRT